MRVEKRVLNDALRVLGKVVCQTSEELYRSIRCVGDVYGVMAMATDGVEVVFLAAILESITGWASLLDDAAEDTTLKRNLMVLRHFVTELRRKSQKIEIRN